MAAGTAPAGLLEKASNDVLPRLEPVPLYLLSQGDKANTAARRVEDLILAELETVPA